MADIAGYSSEIAAPTSPGAPTDRQRMLQNYFRLWATTTETARYKFRRDFEYTEGNGKQWLRNTRREVIASNRPVLEFNQILPQIEYIAGMQRDMRIDYKIYPRNYEDVRLSEIAQATLKATTDFARVHRISDQVFDDATVCGLGVWEILHTNDDADDLIWGDITVARVNPMSFIYDPWAVRMDLQDGAFMGKAIWMDIHAFKDRYPKFAHLATPGEWLSKVGQLIGSSDDYGTGPNLLPELWDQATGRIRVLCLYDKRPVDIVLLVNEQTGQCQECASKDAAEELLTGMTTMAGKAATDPYQIVMQGATTMIQDRAMGVPIASPMTGAPQEFASPEMAQAHLNALSQSAGMQVYDQYEIITRRCTKPQYTEFVYWQELESSACEYKDRKYPYVPYISRRFSDDPESIIGVVRNLQDPQDEYNKRYSNLLGHLNSSSHSGWLNRKSGGANRVELEVMGSKPGVVVEYANVAPQQIKPVELSQGHFNLLQTSERNILRISSVNAEMVGQTTQQTVSGRAIQARQAGGSTALKARFRNYEEASLDLARMLFSRIQQYYTPEKIRRIIGVTELSTPLGGTGMSIFMDPLTGQPVQEEIILHYLKQVQDIEFDIAFATQPYTPTEREAQFNKALQVAALVTQSGRVLGPATYNSIIEMSDMPTKMATALKLDAMAPPVQQPNPAGQTKTLQQGAQQQANGDGASSGGGNDSAGGNKPQAAQQREKEQPYE